MSEKKEKTATTTNTNNEDEELLDSPITVREVNRILENMSNTFSNTLTKVVTDIDDMVSKKINSNTLELSKVLNDHASALKALNTNIKNLNGPATDGGGGHRPQTRKEAIRELIAEVKDITEIPFVKQKLGIESDPLTQEADSLISANWIGAKREFILMQKRQLKRAFQKNLVYPDEVSELIETKTGQAQAIDHHSI